MQKLKIIEVKFEIEVERAAQASMGVEAIKIASPT